MLRILSCILVFSISNCAETQTNISAPLPIETAFVIKEATEESKLTLVYKDDPKATTIKINHPEPNILDNTGNATLVITGYQQFGNVNGGNCTKHV